jgi:sterol desaturase/sphingolipid hydroxylase (fatty acid hydroxylase superfamily)
MDTLFSQFAQSLNEHQGVWRSGVFVSALVVLATRESLRPRRPIAGRTRRWVNHLFLGTVNIVLLRLVLPGGLMALAVYGQGGGVLGWLALGPVASFVLALILLDLLIYTQHVVLHKIPALWILHAPHHGDRALDVSSGLRFHPAEALLSGGVKAIGVLALGAPLAAVIAFEILLSAASLFTHANWHLGRVDRWLRWVIVTPDMHRLHHSRLADETRHNFGFLISFWDRLFGTWQEQPQSGQTGMALGLEEMPEDGLRATLVYPLAHLPNQRQD